LAFKPTVQDDVESRSQEKTTVLVWLFCRDVKKVIEQDLGPHMEYYALMDQCFDFTDREYTYTLCPFDRAAQKNKHGGSETSLGYVLHAICVLLMLCLLLVYCH